MDLKATQKVYNQLEKQILEAQKSHKPIDSYVKKQIEILEEVHDDYIASATLKRPDIQDNINFANVQIKQLQAIASLCKKIGLSTEKYDNKIKEIRMRYLGADFVKERYGEG